MKNSSYPRPPVQSQPEQLTTVAALLTRTLGRFEAGSGWRCVKVCGAAGPGWWRAVRCGPHARHVRAFFMPMPSLPQVVDLFSVSHRILGAMRGRRRFSRRRPSSYGWVLFAGFQ